MSVVMPVSGPVDCNQINNIPYPEKRATFVLWGRGSWEPNDHGTPVCREITFENKTPNSSIGSFSLCGWRDGEVTIGISMGSDRKNFIEYLCRQGFVIDSSVFYFSTRNSAELKKLFNILTENNDIPREYLDIMRPIVDAGRCEPC